MAENCNQRCGPTYHNDLYEEPFTDKQIVDQFGVHPDFVVDDDAAIQRLPGASLRIDLRHLDEPAKVSALQRIWRLLNGS